MMLLTPAPVLSDQVAVLWFVTESPPVGPRASKLDHFYRLLEAVHSFCSLHFFFHYEIKDWGKAVDIASEPIVWSVILVFH